MIFQKIFILSAALGLQSSAQVCPGQNEDLCPVIEKSMAYGALKLSALLLSPVDHFENYIFEISR